MSHHTGELLGGRYRLDDRIATGGMGEVWQATDAMLRRAVAVKTMRADRAIDPQFRSRFRNEARAMAALHHPGIADVYDFGQEPDDDAYLVMARVDGQPLDRRIAERGRLSAAETMSIVAHVGRALQAAHDAGIVHRDVKPGNLIVQPDGSVILVDFGVARSPESAAVTGAKEVVGTAHYIAPEQLSKHAVGPATDVYALGAVAYHCLAGHPPFVGENPVTVAMQHLRDEPPPLPDDVPARARALVTIALAKHPAARFRSAAAMAEAAERAVRPALPEAETTLPRPAGWGTTYAPPPRRHIVMALSLVLMILLGAGAALVATDPFGWFPGMPQPTTSAPAAPSDVPSSKHFWPSVDNSGSGDKQSTGTPTPSPSRTNLSPSPTPSTPPTTATQSASGTPTTPPPSSQTTTEPPVTPAATSAPALVRDGVTAG